MSVCLKSRNLVKTETWSNVFTNFNSSTKSCLFMKQLTHSCISTILYLRKILPDGYFEPKKIEGMTLNLLKSGKEHKYVDKIKKWLEGAFEAIEKKYLKQLMLDIQDANSKTTLEVYTMTFNYPNANDSLSFLSKSGANGGCTNEFTVENTKLTTIKLLQMCFAVTQTYANLPSQISIAMRLSYHENTPLDYQPSGYMPCEPFEPEFPKMTRSIEIGITGTHHHLFKLVNKSCFNDKFFKDMESINENSVIPLNRSYDVEKQDVEKQTKAKRELCFDNCNQNTKSMQENVQNYTEKSKSVSQTKCTVKLEGIPNKSKKAVESVAGVSAAGIERIRCPCLSLQKTDIMLSCLLCNSLVHAECFGIILFDPSKKIRFFCHLCNQPKTEFRCHDKVMANLKNSSDQQKLAVLRRVLKFCYSPQVTKITLKNMEKIAGPKCPKNIVQIVLNKMIEIGVAIKQGKKKNFLINKEELERKLITYFYKSQNSSQSQILINSQESFDHLRRKNTTEEETFVKNKKCKTAQVKTESFQICNNEKLLFQNSSDIFP